MVGMYLTMGLIEVGSNGSGDKVGDGGSSDRVDGEGDVGQS